MSLSQLDSSATEVAVSDTTIYEVTGTNLLGCTATQTISVNVTNCNGGGRMANANGFMVYPNPTSSQITIQCYPAIIENIDIFDARGQLVFSQSLSGNTYQIDMSEYARGLYFIRAKTSDNLYDKKIIVQY